MNQLQALELSERVLPVRTLAALPIALVTTTSLLYLMLRLIATEAVEIDSEPRIKISPFIMEQRPETVIEPRELERPDTPEKQPPVDIFNNPHTDFADNVVAVIQPVAAGTIGSEQPVLGGNSYLVAEIRIQPQYPRQAITRRIEGYVDVEFDIAADGSTRNIRVVQADPAGVFESSSLRAVAKWRYRAPTVDGKATPVFGHRERLRFELN